MSYYEGDCARRYAALNAAPTGETAAPRNADAA